MTYQTITTDILILGSGGAGLFAALHAKKQDPNLSVTIAVKGLLGKCGCTRMVQGGYNVALAPGDSVERHFMDTIEEANGSHIKKWHGPSVKLLPSEFENLKTNSDAFLIGTPMDRSIKKPLRARHSIALCTKGT